MKVKFSDVKLLLNSGMINSKLSTKECQQVLSFLEEFHDVFSLAEGERGETNLMEWILTQEISTEETGRTPDAVCSET